MNFLKAMLIYMSLTFAASVQTGPVPEVTPEPTATPTVAVVETATPAPETEVTAILAPTETPALAETPAPTEGITPFPVPEITPNKKYRNLKSGDRGDAVRALQERLIELGYLQEGQADGAYGAITRRAVMNFQYYNGLVQDGVAGDMTQTYLFENPEAAENPLRPTPTPEPTATPEPTETPEIVTIGGDA